MTNQKIIDDLNEKKRLESARLQDNFSWKYPVCSGGTYGLDYICPDCWSKYAYSITESKGGSR